MLKTAAGKKASAMTLRGISHVAACPPPLAAAIDSPSASPPSALPEFDRSPERIENPIGFPSFSFDGSMELMAVPKKKVFSKFTSFSIFIYFYLQKKYVDTNVSLGRPEVLVVCRWYACYS